MTFALARSLLLAEAVRPEALAEALLVTATRGTSLVRALLAARAIELARLERHLERGDAPYMRHVAPVLSLVQQLPADLCQRLLALPVRRDPRTGTVDVAVVDAGDPHPVEEIAHWLKSPVRMVRTSLVSMEAALRHLHAKPDLGVRALAAPIWAPPARAEPTRPPAETPAYGSPALHPHEGSPSAPMDRVVDTLVGPDPNIPIPLTRKSIVPMPILEIGPSGVERHAQARPDGDPASLLRRKPTPPDPHVPPAPATSRGPFHPPTLEPPFVAFEAGATAPLELAHDLAPALEAIRAAADRDSVLEQLLSSLRAVARRVALFAVKRNVVLGWTCSPEMGERATLRSAKMTAPADSVLTAALQAETVLLARIPKDATHAPLLAAMRTPPAGEVALVALRVEGKAVGLVLADDLVDPPLAMQRMQDVTRAAGEALARLLREKRR
jgi:hypothetical protein